MEIYLYYLVFTTGMNLNLTQRRVLCALNACPGFSDRQLSELLGLQRSTVTTTRHFLKDRKMYFLRLLPDIDLLDASVIGIIYGQYRGITQIDYERRMRIMPRELRIPEYVFSLSAKCEGISMCFGKDFPSLKGPFDKWEACFRAADNRVEIEQVFFPSKTIRAYKFMESQELIASELGVAPFEVRKEKRQRKRLSRKEKRVLLAWVRQPDSTNADIAETAEVSRATVGMMKSRLLKASAVSFVNIPNWHLLGLEMGVITHIKLTPEKEAVLDRIRQCPKVVFLMGSQYEAVFLSFFSSYRSYQKIYSSLMEYLSASRALLREPKEILFSLSEVEYVIDAAPLVGKLLNF